MKKIFESPLTGQGESASKVHVYELESDAEFWELDDMSFYEKCAYFDVVDEDGMEVMPGATYHTYEFCLSSHHCVMVESVALNV